MKKIAFVLLVTLLSQLPACLTKTEPVPLLKIGDEVFQIEDFIEYLRYQHPGSNDNMDRHILDRFLEQFLSDKLLLKAAIDDNIKVPPVYSKEDREYQMIRIYLERKYYRHIRIGEEALKELYDEQIKEPRVKIRSVYFDNERTARQEHQRLRSRPSDFEAMMEKYNPAEFKDNNIATGIFTRLQIPENIRDTVFNVDRPQILNPIEWQNGYLIVQVLEILERQSYLEAKDDLQEQLKDRERSKLKEEAVKYLGKKYKAEFYPEIAIIEYNFDSNTVEGEIK